MFNAGGTADNCFDIIRPGIQETVFRDIFVRRSVQKRISCAVHNEEASMVD